MSGLLKRVATNLWSCVPQIQACLEGTWLYQINFPRLGNRLNVCFAALSNLLQQPVVFFSCPLIHKALIRYNAVDDAHLLLP